MSIRPALQKIVMICLVLLGLVWLFQGARHSFDPEFNFRALGAIVMLFAMIIVLAIACVSRLRAVRFTGAILGLLLAFREYLMISEESLPFRELIREPSGWIGLGLLSFFVVASVVALSGGNRRG
jgi:hypothetical protein